jgi:hypothetical protein
VEVKESVPDRGDCTASALAATALKLSADFGSESCRGGIVNGRGVRSVWACEVDLFFSGELLDRAVELLRPRSEPFERETDGFRRDVDAVELCDSECVVGDPLLVFGLVDVGVLLPPNIFLLYKSEPCEGCCARCISPLLQALAGNSKIPKNFYLLLILLLSTNSSGWSESRIQDMEEKIE